jgi:signal transduction protein with GAF and PtsI domain
MSTGTTNQVLECRVLELRLLQETAKKVNALLDLEKLLDEIVGRVPKAFGRNRTVVLLKDDAGSDLEIIALRGFSNVHLKGYRMKVGGEGMVGHVSRITCNFLSKTPKPERRLVCDRFCATFGIVR